MRNLHRVLLALAFLGIQQILFAGGPWPLGKGNYYSQIGFYGIPPSNTLFDYDYDARFMNRAIGDLSTQLYGEYGLTDKINITLDLPLKIVQAGNEIFTYTPSNTIAAPEATVLDAGTLFGLSNVKAGLMYNFLGGDIPVSAHLTVGAPTGRSNAATGLRTGFDAWTFSPALSAGFGAKKLYGYLQSGLNFRTNAFSHQFFSNLELGYEIKNKAYIALVIQALYSVTEGQDKTAPIQTGLYIDHQEYLAWTLKGNIPLNKKMGLTLSLGGAFMSNNLQQSPSLGLGFYYQMKG